MPRGGPDRRDLRHGPGLARRRCIGARGGCSHRGACRGRRRNGEEGEAPAPQAAGCPGGRLVPIPAGRKAWRGAERVAARPQHAPGPEGLFPASTGVVGRGSRHTPRQWPPALASWGWPGSQTLGHWALCPPTFSAFGGYWVPGLHCVRGHALQPALGYRIPRPN